MDNEGIQLDHIERMKSDSAANLNYWLHVMKIRYPVYMELIKKYKNSGKILDVGCGYADVWYSEYVKVNGYNYYCTDVSEDTLQHMENLLLENGSDVFAKKGSLDNLPWDNNEFDIVFASHILEHCEDINLVFMEIKRVLKKDGILVFAVPCSYEDEPAHTHNRDLHKWQEDFKNNNLRIIESGQFDFNQNEFYGIAIPIQELILPHVKELFLGYPTLDQVVSQTCTASQFQEVHYSRLAREINQEPRFHRKQWEYIYILRALEQFELLAPGRTGLGFGCGKEPLAVVMAKFGLNVVVTDIPPLEQSDSHWGSASVMDLFYGGICSEEEYVKHVSFRAVDMNNIPNDLGLYDFVWSCCALEHLGSLQAGMDFIVNSTKYLKPGGIAIHTTELNMSNDDDTFESPGLSLYRRRDLLDLQNSLIDIGHSVLPMNFYSGDQPEDKYIDLPPYKQEIHLKLMIEKFAITSFGIVLRKN